MSELIRTPNNKNSEDGENPWDSLKDLPYREEKEKDDSWRPTPPKPLEEVPKDKKEIFDIISREYSYNYPELDFLFEDTARPPFRDSSKRFVIPMDLATTINQAYDLKNPEELEGSYGYQLCHTYFNIISSQPESPITKNRKQIISKEFCDCIAKVALDLLFLDKFSTTIPEDKIFLHEEHVRGFIAEKHKTSELDEDTKLLVEYTNKPVARVIFKLDPYFPAYGFDEILMNDDYIKGVYGENVEVNVVKQALEDYYIATKYKALVFEEALRDPFLRELHCKYLDKTTSLNGHEQAVRDALEPLWKKDPGFFGSQTLAAYLEKISKEYPEVYSPKKDALKYVESYSEGISMAVGDFIKTYLDETRKIERAQHDPTNVQGAEYNQKIITSLDDITKQFVTTLAAKFKIKSIPTITYVGNSDNQDVAEWNSTKNTITLYTANISSILTLMTTLTHEMWHAHQDSDSVPEEHRELYRKLYISPKMSYKFYRKQLIEEEAYQAEKLAMRALFDTLVSESFSVPFRASPRHYYTNGIINARTRAQMIHENSSPPTEEEYEEFISAINFE